MIAYMLRIQFGTYLGGPAWYDVSDLVALDLGQLQVTRGRSTEAGAVSPARLEVPLRNDDGAFTPGRPGSPYYPFVQDGAPVELTLLVAAGRNLEDNASMELGVADWSTTGSAAAALSQSTGHVWPDGGAWALLIGWATSAGDGGAQKLLRGFTIGQTYTVSRRVWVPTGSPDVLLRVNGGFVATGSPVSTKNAWAVVQVTFVASSVSHYVEVYAAATPSGGSCWVDAGQAEAGSVATAPSPSALLLPRFYGNVLEWPTQWDGGPALTAGTKMVALGVTARLGERRGNLRSFLLEEQLLDSPVTLLPLDEPDGATQAGNLGSQPAPAELANQGGSGTAEFGSGTGPPADGSSSLVLTRASALNGYYLRAPVTCRGTAITVEAFIATTQTECAVINAAVPRYGDPFYGYGCTVKITSLGKAEWRSNGGLIVTGVTTVTDGLTHHIAATYEVTSTLFTARLYVDGQLDASGTWAAAGTIAMVNYLLAGGTPKLGLFSGTINHVALYNYAVPSDRLRAHWLAGMTAFGGERSDQRISRLAAYADLSSLTPGLRSGVWVLDSASLSILDSTTVLAATDLDTDVGSAMIWGQGGGGKTVIAAMQEVADTEGGIVLEDRQGRLDFHGRARRYNPAPLVRIDLLDGDVQADLTLTYDDQDVLNDVTATTEDGAQARYVDQASVNQRGTYGDTLDLVTRDGADAYSAAAWRVRLHSAPRPRYTQVTVDLRGADEALVAAVAAVDISDRLDLVNLPSQSPTSTAALFAEGYTETYGLDEFTVSFNTSSADGYQVWVLDNPMLSVLDSTTVLAW